MKWLMRIAALTAFVACLESASFADAKEEMAGMSGAQSAKVEHKVINPGDLAWAPTDALPPGVEVAVVEGDPSKKGPFTMRAKLPANYRIPAHWHPNLEHVTVLSGKGAVGMGDKFDESKLMTIEVGGFMVMPPRTNHFFSSPVETEIQIHGVGPWAINYVNPADDPRKKGRTAKK